MSASAMVDEFRTGSLIWFTYRALFFVFERVNHISEPVRSQWRCYWSDFLTIFSMMLMVASSSSSLMFFAMAAIFAALSASM